MAAIHATAGDDVIFQTELPIEMVFVTRAPAQAAMAAFLARGATSLARRAPPVSLDSRSACEVPPASAILLR